jgi:DNA-binding XRE family transcriptional regulator
MGKIKTNDIKFTKSQLEKIERDIGKYIKGFIAEYEELNTNWKKSHLLRSIYRSLIGLKHYIDSDDPEISWERPLCMLTYDVGIDWDNLDLNPGSLNITHNYFKLDKDIKTVRDLMKTSLLGLDAYRDIELFRYLTNDIVAIERDGRLYHLLPEDVADYIDQNNLMGEEVDDFVLESGSYSIEIPFEEFTQSLISILEEGGITEKQLNLLDIKDAEDSLFYEVGSLTLDLENKRAYYPITIGLSLRSIYKLSEINKEFFELIWDKIMDAIEQDINRLDQEDKLPVRGLKNLFVEDKTSGLPCNPYMFNIFSLFLGVPYLINRKLLETPNEALTPEEIKEKTDYLDNVFNKKRDIHYDPDGKKVEEISIQAIISDNPKVRAETDIDATLFKDNPLFQEETLAIYINKTFGAEGLRHLLAILIGLDEAGRTGEFVWNVTDHLERMGYKKQDTRGTYPYERKQTAKEVLKIFTSFFVTVNRKDNVGTGKIKGKRLFYIEGYEKEYYENWVTNESYTIKATDFWYKYSLGTGDTNNQQFTKIFKRIAKENHQKHSITVCLSPLLALFWRLGANKPSRDLSVENVLKWVGVNYPKERNKKRVLSNLRSELDYMVERGYLGKWEVKNSDAQLEEIKNPSDYVLAFYPPDWLLNEFKKLNQKREKFLESKRLKQLAQNQDILTTGEIKRIIKDSGLTQEKFADKIGISSSYLSKIKNGERDLPLELSAKIRELFDVNFS